VNEITPDDVAHVTRVLQAIARDRTLLAPFSEPERKALVSAAGQVSRPSRDEQRRLSRAFRRMDREAAESRDRELRAATEIRVARTADVFVPPPQLVAPAAIAPEARDARDAPEEPSRELEKRRDCYVCKEAFRRLHFFYDAMCPSCAELNYAKRFQTASLAGKVALITGARIKIGFQAALMMLRAGAHVIVTTRFPRDAALRYARESDYEVWKDRLDIHGLDLRHAPSVELFAGYLGQTKGRLDILVNNAAQTVRRPAGYYAHLLDVETQPASALPPDVRARLHAHERLLGALEGIEATTSVGLTSPRQGRGASGDAAGFLAWSGGQGPGLGVRASALLSQLPCAYDDASTDAEMFPAGRTDADAQQVDLREINSWRLRLADVPSPEMLEVQLVNAIAPFILCSKLKPLMLRTDNRDKHIVNVSAMEGQFSRRTKTDKHPHTNMAKAALNMMTLTSAPDYLKDGIHMNAVDTGWVTDEDPAALSQLKRHRHDFQPPLDIVDGAARVCDPFFSSALTGTFLSGKFLKDYREVAW
jgi:NAD(P)-dependent dehydrogenase (short-subunit alcohol dehydrogenase family)